MEFITMKPSSVESGFSSDPSPFNLEFYMLSQIFLSITVTKDSAAALSQLCWSKQQTRSQSISCAICISRSCDVVAGDLGMKKLVLRTQCPHCTLFRGKGCYFRLPLIRPYGLNAHSLVMGDASLTSDSSERNLVCALCSCTMWTKAW